MINPQTRARLVLGADDCGLGSGFHGDLAEFMIYRKALSEEQIQEIENHLTEKFFTTGGPSFSPTGEPSIAPSFSPTGEPSVAPELLASPSPSSTPTNRKHSQSPESCQPTIQDLDALPSETNKESVRCYF